MKNLNNYILEKFRFGKNNMAEDNISNSKVLDEIMDTLYIKDSIDSYWQEGFTDEDYEEIKEEIYKEFVQKYELTDPKKLIFISRKGQCPVEYAKKYKKDNQLWNFYAGKLHDTGSKDIWVKKSLYFTVNAINNNKEIILGKGGPLGGLKICVYEF